MATKTEAIPNQPSSPIIRPPTPYPYYSNHQNPFDNRPLPLPPKYHPTIFQDLNRRSTRPKHTCRRRILYSISIFIFLIFTVLLISFLVIKPSPPKFTVERININCFKKGFDPIVLSPNLNVQMKIFNPSQYMGVIYESDNSVIARYDGGARLGSGGFPTFYLAEKNSTVVDIHLAAVGLQFSNSDREAIEKDQKKKAVPLTLEIRAAIRFKVGNVKTRATALRAFCRLRVNDLVPEPVLISSSCISSLGLWFAY